AAVKVGAVHRIELVAADQLPVAAELPHVEKALPLTALEFIRETQRRWLFVAVAQREIEPDAAMALFDRIRGQQFSPDHAAVRLRRRGRHYAFAVDLHAMILAGDLAITDMA